MKVAIFASAFHPSLGGLEELTRQLALELQRQRHEAIVLTNRWPRNLPREEVFQGIALYRLAFRAPGAGPKSEITFRLSRRAVDRQVHQILSRHAIDVIHVQCVGANGFYAQRASRDTGLPLVVTLQGELTMDATGLFERSAFARQTLKDCLSVASAVTGCSRQTLEEAEAWFGQPLGERGSVIYNGISPSDTKVAPFFHPKPYVLAIGRHVPQKGFDLLLRAMAVSIGDSSFQHDLILAGDGAEHQRLLAFAAELGLQKRVVFTGPVDHDKAMQLFAGCSFFVLPSRHEPFGIVNLEAMAAGKAIIATRVGGVSEIVEDGVNGILVPPEDQGILARSMRLLAGDKELRCRLGLAGKRVAQRFTWPAITEQYLDVYRRAMDAPMSAMCVT